MAAAVRLSEVQVDGADVVWSEGRPAEGGRTQLVRLDPGGDPRRPAARRAERAHRGARVRRRRLVGARRRHLVHRLGRPAAVPARARRRAGADHGRAGHRARRPVRRRRPRPGRRDDRLRPGAARWEAGTGRDRRAQRDRPAGRAPAVGAGGAGQRAGLRGRAAAAPERRDAGLAAVEPPVDAVGRRRAAHPQPGHRRGDPGGRRPGRVGVRAELAPGRLALVPLRPHRLVEPLPLAARLGHRDRWCGMDAEIGVPPWTLGGARYAVLDDGRVVVARRRAGFDGLAVRELDGRIVDLDLPFSAISTVRRRGRRHRGAGGRLTRPPSRGSTGCDLGDGVRTTPCCARPGTWASTPATCRPGADLVPLDRPGRRPAHRARAVLPAGQPRAHAGCPASCRRCWWSSTAARPRPRCRC